MIFLVEKPVSEVVFARYNDHMSSINILKYEYVPPEGYFASWTTGGYVFYNSRLDYLRNRVIQPDKPQLQTTGRFQRVAVVFKDENESNNEAEAVESGFYQLDMHRWVARKVAENNAFKVTNVPLAEIAKASKAFDQVIREFTEKYGDFFTANVHSDLFEEKRLDDWYDQWKIIGDAASDAQTEKGKKRLKEPIPGEKSILNENLFRYTGIGRGPQRSTSIRPINLVGWCWALIARDVLDGITYKRCENYMSDQNPTGCEHEIPSEALDGSLNMKFCSAECEAATR